MKFDNNINFWKALLGFVNDVGSQCAQGKVEWKIEDANRDDYFSYMKKHGFNSNEVDIKAAFERLKVVDLRKEKQRIINKIRRLE